jgi:hypothetical protein
MIKSFIYKGAVALATSSFTNNVYIKDKRLAKGLSSALKNAENKVAKHVELSKRLDEIKKDEIKKMFNEE